MLPGRPVDITGGVPSEEWVQSLHEDAFMPYLGPENAVNPQPPWQRPIDASPEDQQDVLAWILSYDPESKRDVEQMVIARFYAEENGFRHGWCGCVLFWRPLPDPPTEVNDASR